MASDDSAGSVLVRVCVRARVGGLAGSVLLIRRLLRNTLFSCTPIEEGLTLCLIE